MDSTTNNNIPFVQHKREIGGTKASGLPLGKIV